MFATCLFHIDPFGSFHVLQDKEIAKGLFNLMNEMNLNQTDVQLDDIIVSIVQLDYGMNVCLAAHVYIRLVDHQ